VTFSTRPLTIRELTNIIGAEVLADVTASHQGVQVGSELFTAVCAGVLAIDSDISTLRAAHVTLKEYLQRNREDIFPQLQEYITTSCVEYLSLQDFNVGPCKFQSQCSHKLFATYPMDLSVLIPHVSRSQR
jgi:hypothetical protein